uniref:Uncharacterized protein n=1 Tax=Setaria digitata TaxID=48799 RepID=A0A915PKS1_9BILA
MIGTKPKTSEDFSQIQIRNDGVLAFGKELCDSAEGTLLVTNTGSSRERRECCEQREGQICQAREGVCPKENRSRLVESLTDVFYT